MRRSGGFAEVKKRFGKAEKRRHCQSRSQSEVEASSFALPSIFRFGGADAEKRRLRQSEEAEKRRLRRSEAEASSFALPSLFLSSSASAEPMRRSGSASPKSEGIGGAEAEAKKRFGFAEKRRLRRSEVEASSFVLP
jgi:hypothetical protein